MPGLLRSDAWCPICGRDIIALSRSTKFIGTRGVVTLEFMHRPEDYKYDHVMRGEVEQMDRIHDRLHPAPAAPPAPSGAKQDQLEVRSLTCGCGARQLPLAEHAQVISVTDPNGTEHRLYRCYPPPAPAPVAAPRCACCGHPPHRGRLCQHPEPTWDGGMCHCAGEGIAQAPREAAPCRHCGQLVCDGRCEGEP